VVVSNHIGRIVPVAELRLKFGLPETARTVDACIIILELLAGGEQSALGTLAYLVQEVMDIEPKNKEPGRRWA